MSMAETLSVLGKLVADEVIGSYAIAGAVAAYNYIEPTVTEDVDVLITLDTPESSGLITLTPILTALHAMGYAEFRAEGVVIGDWPVQFLPVASALDAEALRTAEQVNVTIQGQSFETRILRPEYLVAKALEVGRPKDHIRVVQFVEEKAVDLARLQDVLQRFGLSREWETLRRRSGIQREDDGNE